MNRFNFIIILFLFIVYISVLYHVLLIKLNNLNNLNYLNKLSFYDVKKMYVINLQKNIKRYNDFIKNATKANVNVSRFNATLGIQLQNNDKYIKKYFDNNINLTKPQLGCAISHIRIWEDAVNNNHDVVIVFEDDAIIPPDFISKINNVFKQLPEDWDMLLLGINSGYCKKYNIGDNLLQFQKGKQAFIEINKGNWGLFAYVLNIKFAKELLNQKFTNTVDNYIRDNYYYNNNFKIYLTNPIIVNHEYDNYSDIINKNRGGEAINNNNIKIYNKLLNFIYFT